MAEAGDAKGGRSTSERLSPSLTARSRYRPGSARYPEDSGHLLRQGGHSSPMCALGPGFPNKIGAGAAESAGVRNALQRPVHAPKKPGDRPGVSIKPTLGDTTTMGERTMIDRSREERSTCTCDNSGEDAAKTNQVTKPPARPQRVRADLSFVPYFLVNCGHGQEMFSTSAARAHPFQRYQQARVTNGLRMERISRRGCCHCCTSQEIAKRLWLQLRESN